MTSDDDLRRRFTLLADWAEQQEPVLPLVVPRTPGAVGRRTPARGPSLRLAPAVVGVLAAACVLLVWAVVTLRPNGSPAPPSVATSVLPANPSTTVGASVAPAPRLTTPTSDSATATARGGQPSSRPRGTDAGAAAGGPSGGAGASARPGVPGASHAPAVGRTPGGAGSTAGGGAPGTPQPPDESTLPQGVSYALTAGGTSVYSAGSSYAAAVTGSRVVGNDLQVSFHATGPADLARPEPTCLTLTTPGGVSLVRTPSAVHLTTNASGDYAGTLTYSNLQPGAATLRYACRSDFSVAPVGVIGRPGSGVFWPLADPGAPLNGPGLTVAVTGSSMANGVLSVSVDATGMAELLQPANACLKVTAPNGTATTRAPDSVDLTTSLPTRAAGTLKWSGLPSGEITLTYACLGVFGTAFIGTLG